MRVLAINNYQKNNNQNPNFKARFISAEDLARIKTEFPQLKHLNVVDVFDRKYSELVKSLIPEGKGEIVFSPADIDDLNREMSHKTPEDVYPNYLQPLLEKIIEKAPTTTFEEIAERLKKYVVVFNGIDDLEKRFQPRTTPRIGLSDADMARMWLRKAILNNLFD